MNIIIRRTALAWLATLGLLLSEMNCNAERSTLAGLADSEYSSDLQALVDRSIATATNSVWTNRLDPGQVAVTLADLSDPAHPRWASTRGNEPIYPASVVKLFYLVATHRWL